MKRRAWIGAAVGIATVGTVALGDGALGAGARADAPAHGGGGKATGHTPSNSDVVEPPGKPPISASPNRHIGSDAQIDAQSTARGAKTVCALSPEEALLVGELRTRLEALKTREVAALASEAKLTRLLGQLERERLRVEALRTDLEVQEAAFDDAVQTRCIDLVGLEQERIEAAEAFDIGRCEEAARRIAGEELARMNAGKLAIERTVANEKADSDTAKAERVAAEAKAHEDLAAATALARTAEAERIAQLGAIVKKMKPNDAARVIADQPDSAALALLGLMGVRNAAKLMPLMPAARTSALAKAMVEGELATDAPAEVPKPPAGSNKRGAKTSPTAGAPASAPARSPAGAPAGGTL